MREIIDEPSFPRDSLSLEKYDQGRLDVVIVNADISRGNRITTAPKIIIVSAEASKDLVQGNMAENTSGRRVDGNRASASPDGEGRVAINVHIRSFQGTKVVGVNVDSLQMGED